VQALRRRNYVAWALSRCTRRTNSKIFKALMGSESGRIRWRESGT
jgi:trehalose utilization protein